MKLRMLAPHLALASLALAQPAALFPKSFEPPDGSAPYTCTFHWFRTADGRIVGMDVVRSGDQKRLGLRLFVATDQGELRSLIHEAPEAEWEPFATAAAPGEEGARNALGRGKGWIGGRVSAAKVSPQAIERVFFDLKVEATTKGLTAGDLGLDFVNLSATDFPRVRTRGTLVIDGERLAIDAEGPCSIHFGRELPDYGYLATVPQAGTPAPDLLLASTRGDNLRRKGQLLGERAFTYSYWSNLPQDFPFLKFFSLDKLAPARSEYAFPIASKTVKVARILAQRPHVLLGRATTTYVAEVELHVPLLFSLPPFKRAVHKVIAIGDVRGDYYIRHLDGLGKDVTPTTLPAAAKKQSGSGMIGGLDGE